MDRARINDRRHRFPRCAHRRAEEDDRATDLDRVEQLLTADAVADAVVTYATVLARAETADTITIPIVRDDGGIDEARLLLGPASQLTIVPDGHDDVQLPDAAAVVEDLEHRTARLEPQPIASDAVGDDAESAFPDFDDYA